MTRPLAFALASIIIWGWLSVLQGQSAPPTPPSTYPANFYAAGTVWNQTKYPITSPHLTGFASYAKKINDSGPVYSFTTYDVTNIGGKGLGLQTSVRTGVCTVVRKVWIITSLACLDGGMAQTATNAGGAFGQSAGGVAPLCRKCGLAIYGSVRHLITGTAPATTFYEAALGYEWPKP